MGRETSAVADALGMATFQYTGGVRGGDTLTVAMGPNGRGFASVLGESANAGEDAADPGGLLDEHLAGWRVLAIFKKRSFLDTRRRMRGERSELQA